MKFIFIQIMTSVEKTAGDLKKEIESRSIYCKIKLSTRVNQALRQQVFENNEKCCVSESLKLKDSMVRYLMLNVY